MGFRFDRRDFLKAGAASAGLLAVPGWLNAFAAPDPTTGGRKPNIILILSDDHSIPGVSCYGGEFQTPQLDAMAKKGVRFEYCFSEPLCAPSRAMLMTGRFPFRTGVISNNAVKLSPETETVIPKLLKQVGYSTGLAGKWSQLPHIDTAEEAAKWGFDEFMIWDPKGERYWNPSLNKNGQQVPVTDKSFGPDLLNDFVVDFASRHKDSPFFIYYPMTLIHSQLFQTPDHNEGDKKKNLLAENILYMDKLVGKLLSELERMKMDENTLIMFTGDNGQGLDAKVDGKMICGNKGSMLEGGSRVPLIASWKGTVPAGTVVKDMVEFSDFYATIAELAGAKMPENLTFDSRSFAQQLKGKAGDPRNWVFIQLQDEWYVRSRGWKLNQKGELFDMKEAPFKEIPVEADSKDPGAVAARKELQAVLDDLKPAGRKGGDRAGNEDEGKGGGKKREKKAEKKKQ